ncbi:MAG: VanZ family protein [Pseudomonadota bacterium]
MNDGNGTVTSAWTRKRRRSIRHWPVFYAAGWALIALIGTLSLWPSLSVPDVGVSWSDKIGHFGAYLTLMIWFAWLYLRPAHGWIALRLIALGIAIELLQWLSGYRYFELADIAANTAGVVVGWLLAGTRRFHRL